MTSGNRGHQAVSRWHIVDNVPFQQSFEGCLEKVFHDRREGNRVRVYGCWYLSPDGKDAYEPVPVEQRLGYYVNKPAKAGGFQILGTPPGNLQTQNLKSSPGASGKETTNCGGPAPNPATSWNWRACGCGRQIPGQRGADQGPRLRHRAAVRGRTESGRADRLVQPGGHSTEPLPLGTHELTAGDHKLTVEIVGANEQAVKSYMFGLDRGQA